MANRDGSKIECFRLWSAGASIEEIERQVTAKPESVRDWIPESERGRQVSWQPNVRQSANVPREI
jgi:hypothetical protein